MKKRLSYVSNSSSSSYVVVKDYKTLKELLKCGKITHDEFDKLLAEYRSFKHRMKHEKWRGVKWMKQPNWNTGMTSLFNLKYVVFGKPYEELKKSYVNMVWKTQKGIGYAMPVFSQGGAVTLLQVWQLMNGKSDKELKSMFIKKIWTVDDMKQAVKDLDIDTSFMTQEEFFDVLNYAVFHNEEQKDVVESLQSHVRDAYKEWCWEQEELEGYRD